MKMNRPIRVIVFCLLLASVPEVKAQRWLGDATLRLCAGWNVGGTAPVGLPASIRSLNTYKLQPNLSFGLTVDKPIAGHWGLETGLVFENKGMRTDAGVKNYHMDIVRGGQELEGRFTGSVTTSVREWMFTVPVHATYAVGSRLTLHGGPYFSVLTSKGFSGAAHNGYLRVGNPTGVKVELGSDEATRGNYDFSEHMRYLQWGLGVGADWYMGPRFGFYAALNWGLSGIHHSDFHTIEQTLYPIFGSIGFTYKLKNKTSL